MKVKDKLQPGFERAASTGLDGLVITIKPSSPLRIEIDLDAVTFDDVMLLQKMDTASNDELAAAMQLISRIIGQEARALPIRRLKAVIASIMRGINESTDQGN
jgi:hypothetical protein